MHGGKKHRMNERFNDAFAMMGSFGINVATEFPIIHGICERLEGLEAFRKAHPDAQPDKPHQQ